MSNPILDLLGDVGYAMDTPGAYLRGALAGKVGERASGEDMLNSWGVDAGPLGGMAAEVVADPLAIAGLAGGAYKAARGIHDFTRAAGSLSHADDANPVVKALAGFVGDQNAAFQPFREIGRRTDPDFVNSVPWYHGTGTPGLTPQSLDPMKTDPEGLFGRGIYKTANPELASEYAATRAKEGLLGWSKDTHRAARLLSRSEPDVTAKIESQLLGLTSDPSNFTSDPTAQNFLIKFAESQAGRPPGRFLEAFTDNAGEMPELAAKLKAILGSAGVRVPDMPAETIYEAGTNYGKILDLDRTADPGFLDAIREYAGNMDAQFPAAPAKLDWGKRMGATNALGRLDRMASEGAKAGDVLQAFLPGKFGDAPLLGPDPMIAGLRAAGYDALTHTGGLRAGGGDRLHDVLIGLDPNDTVSKVGRAGQITRFEPQQIEDLLRQMRGG